MADLISIKDGNAVSRDVYAKDLTSNLFLQGFLPRFMVGSAAQDVTSTVPLPTDIPLTSYHHRVTTASTNAVNVKSSAGTLRRLTVTNLTSSPIYVKFHNSAGTPTAGTGVVWSVGIQAGITLQLPFIGLSFATGIAMTVVAGAADSDSAVSEAGAIVEVGYS